jgi:hypothetical protein
MALFKTINTTIDKPAYSIKIANFDISSAHWASENLIASTLAEFENATHDFNDFDEEVIKLALRIKKLNHRIIRSTFYTIKDEPNLTILAHIVKIPTFDIKRGAFEREARIDIKGKNKSLLVIDIPEDIQDLIERKRITMPEAWIYNEGLNNTLDIYSELA